MRLVAILFIAACAPPPQVPHKPLPELVSSAQPATPLPVTALALPPGESLIWSVHWKGLTIGRAELSVSDREARSRFKTDALVNTMVSIEYDLATIFDRATARVTSATENLTINGETKQVAETFDGASYAITGDEAGDGRSFSVPGGNPGHTLHSALGAIRAWAAPEARPGFLFIVHAGQLARLDVMRPVTEELQGTKTLRVECRVRPGIDKMEPFAVTVWLTADQKRAPIRIEVTNAGEHVTAELIDTAAV
jgi:Protein of unknown function (DUF3108)